MLAWMLSLPRTMVFKVLTKITLPVMLIYPLATALLGKLMIRRKTQLESEKALAKRERYLRTILLTTAVVSGLPTGRVFSPMSTLPIVHFRGTPGMNLSG